MSTAVTVRQFLSIADAARVLGVAPITIRRRIEAGELVAIQLGGPGTAVRIPRPALEQWLVTHSNRGGHDG